MGVLGVHDLSGFHAAPWRCSDEEDSVVTGDTEDEI